jgi:hypothetical protein
MKTTITPLLVITILATCALRAQNETQSPAPVQEVSSAKGAHHGKHHPWLASLSDQEKSQLKAAMKKIKDDPQLVAARQALKDAQTKEAKVAAHESLRNTRRDLLLKADPSIAPVLDKIKDSKPSRHSAS